jgi:hypothetical protein
MSLILRNLQIQNYSDSIVPRSVKEKQTKRNGGTYKEFYPHDLPFQFVECLIKLRNLGLSVADMEKSYKSLSYYKPSYPPNIVDISPRIETSNGLIEIKGSDLVSQISNRFPDFEQGKGAMVQCSANISCERKTGAEYAKFLVDQGYYLIMGGQGCDNSEMYEVYHTYLNYGGKGVIIVIPEFLNKSGTGHQEKIKNSDPRVMIIEVNTIAERLEAFRYIATIGDLRTALAAFGIGGNGTLSELWFALLNQSRGGGTIVEDISGGMWHPIIDLYNLSDQDNLIVAPKLDLRQRNIII